MGDHADRPDRQRGQGAICRLKKTVAFERRMYLLGVAPQRKESDIAVTLAGEFLTKIGDDAGFTPYDVQSGCHTTSKLARFRMASGRPIVIQIDTKVAHVWLLTEDVTPRIVSLGGRIRHYSATQSRNHHLDQVREFRSQPLTNIEVKATDPLAIHAAFIGH